MVFKKNDPNINKAGRPKGSPNRSTDELREIIQKFISENLERLQEDFDKLKPSERLNFIEKLLKHVLPAPLTDFDKLTDEQLNDIINELKINKK